MTTPARFARGYLHFVEDGHHRGAARVDDLARLAAYQRVLGWVGQQEAIDETRFTRLLADRAASASDGHVRWVCQRLLHLWSIPHMRATYANRWADVPPASVTAGAPWDQFPGGRGTEVEEQPRDP